MLKKSASGVLASLRGLNVRPKVRFASSLAVALLDGFFEHPESVFFERGLPGILSFHGVVDTIIRGWYRPRRCFLSIMCGSYLLSFYSPC
jgi:hypothetical protein